MPAGDSSRMMASVSVVESVAEPVMPLKVQPSSSDAPEKSSENPSNAEGGRTVMVTVPVSVMAPSVTV